MSEATVQNAEPCEGLHVILHTSFSANVHTSGILAMLYSPQHVNTQCRNDSTQFVIFALHFTDPASKVCATVRIPLLSIPIGSAVDTFDSHLVLPG
jgi:hypothetical protein